MRGPLTKSLKISPLVLLEVFVNTKAVVNAKWLGGAQSAWKQVTKIDVNAGKKATIPLKWQHVPSSMEQWSEQIGLPDALKGHQFQRVIAAKLPQPDGADEGFLLAVDAAQTNKKKEKKEKEKDSSTESRKHKTKWEFGRA